MEDFAIFYYYIYAYIGGGGDRKCLKMCVRNIWMVPEDVLAISVHVRLMSVADDCGYERPLRLPRLLRL